MFGYSDWKLRNKLTLPLLFVVVLSALAISFGFNTMIVELTEDALPEERAIAGIRSASLDLIGEYREFVIDPSESVLAEINEIKEAIEEFEDSFKETAAHEINEQHFVREIEDAEQQLKNTGGELVALRQALDEQLNVLESIEDKFELTETYVPNLSWGIQLVMETTDAKIDPDQLSQEIMLPLKLAYTLSRHAAEIREYVTNPNDETKEEITEFTEIGRTGLATFQRLIMNDPERFASFHAFQSKAEELTTTGIEVVRLSDAYHLQLEQLEVDADALLDILDVIGQSITDEANDAIADGYYSVNLVLVISLISVLAIGWFVSIAVVKSVNALGRATEAYGRGNLNPRVDVSQKDEIGLLGSAFNQMAANIQQHEAEQKKAEEALRMQSGDELLPIYRTAGPRTLQKLGRLLSLGLLG